MPSQTSCFSLEDQFAEARENVESFGFALLTDVFSTAELDRLQAQVEAAVHSENTSSRIKSQSGVAYAARNLLDSVELTRTLWKKPQLLRFLEALTGPRVGLVRGLYFDKHPQRTWSLGWHKDLTIAVEDNEAYRRLRAQDANQRLTSRFSKPTRKSGVAHVEADQELLKRMLTLRIRLDPVTESNGPLEVIPGSHSSKESDAEALPSRRVFSERGGVLAMRPLISHASGSSLPGTQQHRRIVHLEFAPAPELAAGFRWHRFFPGHEFQEKGSNQAAVERS